MRIQVFIPIQYNDHTPIEDDIHKYFKWWIRGAFHSYGLTINEIEGEWGDQNERMRILQLDLEQFETLKELARNILQYFGKVIALTCGQEAVHIVIDSDPYDIKYDQEDEQKSHISSISFLGYNHRTQELIVKSGLTFPDVVDDAIPIRRPINTGSSNFFTGYWSTDQIKITTETEKHTFSSDVNIDTLSHGQQNNDILCLKRITPVLSDVKRLHMELSTASYFDHLKLRYKLSNEEMTKENMAMLCSILDGIPDRLPVAVAIAPIVITSDRYLLVARRSAGLSVYPKVWSATLEEIMEPNEDLIETLRRGIKQELACQLSENTVPRWLSFNFDRATISIDIIVIATLTDTWNSAKANFLGIIDRYGKDQELAVLDGIFLPDTGQGKEVLWQLCKQLCTNKYKASKKAAVKQPITEDEPWGPTARLRLYQFLVHQYGKGYIDGAICRAWYELAGKTV